MFVTESLGEVPGVTVTVEPSAPVAAFRGRPDREHSVRLGEYFGVAGSDRLGDRFGHTVEAGSGGSFGRELGVVEHTAHRRGPGGVFEVGADISEVAGQMRGALGVRSGGEFFTVVGGEPVVHDHPAIAGQHPDRDDRVDPPAGVTGEQRELRCRSGVDPTRGSTHFRGGFIGAHHRTRPDERGELGHERRQPFSGINRQPGQGPFRQGRVEQDRDGFMRALERDVLTDHQIHRNGFDPRSPTRRTGRL